MMKKLMKLVIGACLALSAGAARAETVNYYDPVSKTTKTAYDVVPVTADTGTFEDGKWYVVTGMSSAARSMSTARRISSSRTA